MLVCMDEVPKRLSRVGWEMLDVRYWDERIVNCVMGLVGVAVACAEPQGAPSIKLPTRSVGTSIICRFKWPACMIA